MRIVRDIIFVMELLNDAIVRSAGAYVAIGRRYAFTVGWKLHNGNIPVVRLGGHVEPGESGWQCASREVAEEAALQIRAVEVKQTYLVSAEDPQRNWRVIAWDRVAPGELAPLLALAYHTKAGTLLSLMYLAQADELPVPSNEVKGILLLDAENIRAICNGGMTLEAYLQKGGKAILHWDYDKERLLEPFIQLKLLAQMIQEQRLAPLAPDERS